MGVKRKLTQAILVMAVALLAAACGNSKRPGDEIVKIEEHAPRLSVPDLDPASIPKFVEPLVVPPVMPPTGVVTGLSGKAADYYEIAARQFTQQVLPKSYPMTTVWGYGSANHPGTFNYPAFTIEAKVGKPVRVKWLNQLVDQQRRYLSHLFPVDQTLHWANPPGPRDSMGSSTSPYAGPVPIVTHLHGAHVEGISDGFPEAWYLPNATNIPSGYFTQGTHYDSVAPTGPGAAVFEYRNDQRATTLWYHDHTMGMTRVNVYAGLAGFYLLRGGGAEDGLDLPGRAPKRGDKAGKTYYELPIVIQDRSFNTDGSFFYPDSREYFEDAYAGPYIPITDVPPIWNPEFFGNAIVVNGRTWPYHNVEPRKYRLRLLNGCNARFLILKFSKPVPVHQIGNEGGFLPAPVEQSELLMAPAERADVIVDFSGFTPGDEIVLLNGGPDSPFGGLPVDEPSNPATTGQIMKFKIVSLKEADTSSVPSALPTATPLGSEARTRDLTLNEKVSTVGDFPIGAFIGTGADGPLSFMGTDANGMMVGTPYKDISITENPGLDDTEVWRIVNLTEDAHPIHVHQVAFEVVDRTPFDVEAYGAAQAAYRAGGKVGPPPNPMAFATGPAEGPLPWEAGTKDTVIANPLQLTRIKARFDIAGLFVWHCHILEHEDNDMMRPYFVGPIPASQ